MISNGCNYSSISGLRKFMLVKLSLFVLSDISTDRKKLGHRLPSEHQQEGSNLPSISSYTPSHIRRNDRTHTSWQYKDFFLSVKSPQYDRKWHALVLDGHRSTTNLFFLSAEYIRVNCGLYGPRAGGLGCHRRGKTHSLLGQSFEHAQNLSAGKSDLRAHLRVSPGEIRVKYWQARTFCGGLRAATCPQGLPGKL